MTARPAVSLLLCALCALGCREPSGGGPPEATPSPPVDEALATWVDAVGDRALLTVVVYPEPAQALLGAIDTHIRTAAPALARDLPDPMKYLDGLGGPLPDWDRSRPVVGAFFEPAFSGPAGTIAARLPDPLDRQRPLPAMRHRLLIPSKAPAKLSEALRAALKERGWRAVDGAFTVGSEATVRIFPESDRVRLEMASDGAPPSEWSTPASPSARTPAHAALVAADGPPMRVLVRPWHLRAVFVQHGARMIAEALAAAPPDLAPLLASHGMGELMVAEGLMHGHGAEFDDSTFTLGGDGAAIDLRAVATLTPTGRAILERRGRHAPLATAGGTAVGLALAMDLRAMLDAAAVPEGFAAEQGGRRLSRVFAECGIGCPIHALSRRPFGALKALAAMAAQELPLAAGELRAPQVAFFGMQAQRPRVAMAWQVPAAADLSPVRAAIARARMPGLEMWTRPLDGGAQAVIVGMGITAEAAFGAPLDGAPLSGLVFDPSKLAGMPPGGAMIAALLTGAEGRMDAAGGALVGQLRIGFEGSPAALTAARAQPVFADSPIDAGSGGPAAVCLRQAARETSAALRAVSAAAPDMRGALLERALGEMQADLTCAERDGALKPAVHGLRRLILLSASSAELKGWRPEGAVNRLRPLCEAGDADVCARLKAVDARPALSLPAFDPMAPTIDNCPLALDRGTPLRITEAGVWLGDRKLPEGHAMAAALREAGGLLQLGVDASLPWSRVAPVVAALIEAEVPEVLLVGERQGRIMAVPARIRLPSPEPTPNRPAVVPERKTLPRGTPVSLAADGARIGGRSATPEDLRMRRIEQPDAVFDVYPAEAAPWRLVAHHALAVCGAAVLTHGAPPPSALLDGRLGHGTLDGSLLGRIGGVGLGSGDPDAPREGIGSDPGTGTGSLDKAIIRRVIRRHTNQVRYCYEKALRLSPELSGKVIGRFEVRTDGSVGGVEVGGSLGDAAVERCISKVLGRLRFPKSRKPTRVSYPFVFKPG